MVDRSYSPFVWNGSPGSGEGSIILLLYGMPFFYFEKLFIYDRYISYNDHA